MTQQLTVGQVEDIFHRMLPDFLKEDEVKRIAMQVFEELRDKKAYAPEKHSHDLSDIRNAQELIQGLAKQGHRHDVTDVDGLVEHVAAAVSRIEVPTDYATKDHRHSVDDLAGAIPLTRIAGIETLLLRIAALEELKGHDHPELRQAIKNLRAQVEALPTPKDYDDTRVFAAIQALGSRVDALPKPDTRPVEVTITPVPAPSITCLAEYVVLASEPSGPHVRDAKGIEGTARVTARGTQYLVRGMFQASPAFPLTFSFDPHVPPPVLCSIGSLIETKTS
jgi:polyhydroxyalkanoate synthesis regulator phasin